MKETEVGTNSLCMSFDVMLNDNDLFFAVVIINEKLTSLGTSTNSLLIIQQA